MKIIYICFFFLVIGILASTFDINEAENIQNKLLSFAYKKAQSSSISLKINAKAKEEQIINNHVSLEEKLSLVKSTTLEELNAFDITKLLNVNNKHNNYFSDIINSTLKPDSSDMKKYIINLPNNNKLECNVPLKPKKKNEDNIRELDKETAIRLLLEINSTCYNYNEKQWFYKLCPFKSTHKTAIQPKILEDGSSMTESVNLGYMQDYELPMSNSNKTISVKKDESFNLNSYFFESFKNKTKSEDKRRNKKIAYFQGRIVKFLNTDIANMKSLNETQVEINFLLSDVVNYMKDQKDPFGLFPNYRKYFQRAENDYLLNYLKNEYNDTIYNQYVSPLLNNEALNITELEEKEYSTIKIPLKRKISYLINQNSAVLEKEFPIDSFETEDFILSAYDVNKNSNVLPGWILISGNVIQCLSCEFSMYYNEGDYLMIVSILLLIFNSK